MTCTECDRPAFTFWCSDEHHRDWIKRQEPKTVWTNRYDLNHYQRVVLGNDWTKTFRVVHTPWHHSPELVDVEEEYTGFRTTVWVQGLQPAG